MTADQFKRWLVKCKENGISENKLAKAIGCHRHSLVRWKVSGSPRTIDLAIAAVMAGLPPYSP